MSRDAPRYARLRPDKIKQTLDRLHLRISERFPGRGIAEVCAELRTLADEETHDAERLARPHYATRVLAVLLVSLAGGVAVYGLWSYRSLDLAFEAFHVFQGLEALLNLTILAAAGAWFLLSLEARIRRGRALAALHKLRSFAHVIDMHQLTKDPTAILGPRTDSSPTRDMSRYELTRYLDYCAEMLALIGKLAALHMTHTRDAAVISAVNEIEDLTSGLTRKIWQKITLMQTDPMQTDQSAQQASHAPPSERQTDRPPERDDARKGSLHSPEPVPRATANDTCSPLHPFALGEWSEE